MCYCLVYLPSVAVSVLSCPLVVPSAVYSHDSSIDLDQGLSAVKEETELITI